MNRENKPTLIHVAKFYPYQEKECYLFLRKQSSRLFTWYKDTHQREVTTEVMATTTKEAIRLAYRLWKKEFFRPIICGFRYTLPERDEHGMNALFHQMTASYSSPTGIYFDEDLGHNCYVQNASQEALELWKTLKKSHRL